MLGVQTSRTAAIMMYRAMSSSTAFFLLFISSLACNGPSAPGHAEMSHGMVEMAVSVGDVEVDEIRFRIERGATVVREGVIPVAALAGSRVTARIGMIPGGGPYVLMAEAVREGDPTPVCAGRSEPFSVTPPSRTPVRVVLGCEGAQTSGSVAINADLRICPGVDISLVAPSVIEPGVRARVESTVSDASSTSWSASTGSFAEPEALVTEFTCGAAGLVQLELTAVGVAPEGVEPCETVARTTVQCVDEDSSVSMPMDGGDSSMAMNDGGDAGVCSLPPAPVFGPTGGFVRNGCPCDFDDGITFCTRGYGETCCGGRILAYFDGPCFTAFIPDSGITQPDCAQTPTAIGCPCTDEGAIACSFPWRNRCDGQTWQEQVGYVCCGQ